MILYLQTRLSQGVISGCGCIYMSLTIIQHLLLMLTGYNQQPVIIREIMDEVIMSKNLDTPLLTHIMMNMVFKIISSLSNYFSYFSQGVDIIARSSAIMMAKQTLNCNRSWLIAYMFLGVVYAAAVTKILLTIMLKA